MSTTSFRAALPRRFPSTTLALAIALMLGGCASQRTSFEPVQTKTPAAWNQRTAGAEVTSDQWWKQFGDPELNGLIERALRTNNNLAVAAIKVRRAQLDAGLADDARIPALSATGATTGNRRLDGARNSYRTSTGNVTLSYEADLWGRLGANYDVKRWEALATEQDRQSTALTLVGTTANLYWTGAYLNGRIALANESIAYAQKTLELIRTQYRAGSVSTLEILEAEQNLTTQQSTLTQLIQQQVENDNALAILFDSPPGATTALPARLPQQALPDLAAGLPADLLGRRPDLRAAEMRLRESLATVDATRTSYYPKLTLTGALGTSSDALVRLMQNPVATLGAQLTLPFLQWNQMQLNVKISQADYESAVTTFRQTLYAAFGDVENALSARRQYAAQEALLQQNLAAAQGAERLYELRYRSGSATLRVWLDAQEKRRTAENSLAEARLNRLKNQMTLYQALGGDAQVTPDAGLAKVPQAANS
ncbi:efflux transporter outer membrane subunit [Herbaspirillum sp. alder98]|uniref:efflux transporter outer membrane subunit n=1 Tax=Herbaspirillum sp. alder98 TaxID=2913096 RepID=UPI001CD8DB0E|nr:efflux transporter outer membrane subunit [Herbaspirillum sp. alder98]MCA1322603.1 efflux transporter outer membrane subunit [Herbaspirillum sp. alder98]